MSLNCRSVRNKTAALKELLTDNKVDFVFLQETWLVPGETSIHGELKEMGYKINSMERKEKKGGGLLTLINAKIITKFSKIFINKYNSFDNIVTVGHNKAK